MCSVFGFFTVIFLYAIYQEENTCTYSSFIASYEEDTGILQSLNFVESLCENTILSFKYLV